MHFNKLQDKKMMRLLFWLCWAAYFTSYIGRLNYSSVMPVMIRKAILTSSEAGIISMTYFFAYGIGQLINGLLGDRLRPELMIFGGLFVAGAANLVMPFGRTYLYMSIVWALNGYAQSMIWPPIIRIFSEMLSEVKRIKYCIDITSSQVLGALGAYILSAVFLLIGGWKSVFFVAAILLIAISFIWYFGFRRLGATSYVINTAYTDGRLKACTDRQAKNRKGLIAVLAASGLLVLVLPDAIHGMLKDGVTAWIPTYMAEVFHIKDSFAILVTTVLPIVNLTGAYAASFVYRKLKRNAALSAGVFFLLSALALSGIKLAGKVSIVVTILLFALITASMMAVNTVFVSLLPLRFEKEGRVSSVSGFMNSIAYLGTAISTFTIGLLVDHFGWTVTMLGLLGITAAALMVCLVIGRKNSKHH